MVDGSKPLVWIIVAGDLGRSPRMVRQAEQLAAEGFHVELVGLSGRELPSPVRDHRSISERRVQDWPRHSSPAMVLLRQLLLMIRFAMMLVRLPRPAFVMLQNPPLVTVILIPAIRSRLQRFPLWIDWHNTGEAMASARFGDGVRSSLIRRIENWSGRLATTHTAVSHALVEHLRSARISAETLYDAPMRTNPIESNREVRDDDAVQIVLPMSWSVDDDLELLFDALTGFERMQSDPQRAMTLVITGDGPRRCEFMERIERAGLTRTSVRSTWIPADQYMGFLAGCDLGLSIHQSASGMDLPIKWIDILQAGLPLLTLDYGAAAEERLSQLPSSRRFSSAQELAGALREISSMTAEAIREWKRDARRDLAGWACWQEEWRSVASPIATKLAREGSRT